MMLRKPTWWVCPICGGDHTGPCPGVKTIKFYPDDRLMRIEYRVRMK